MSHVPNSWIAPFARQNRQTMEQLRALRDGIEADRRDVDQETRRRIFGELQNGFTENGRSDAYLNHWLKLTQNRTDLATLRNIASREKAALLAEYHRCEAMGETQLRFIIQHADDALRDLGEQIDTLERSLEHIRQDPRYLRLVERRFAMPDYDGRWWQAKARQDRKDAAALAKAHGHVDGESLIHRTIEQIGALRVLHSSRESEQRKRTEAFRDIEILHHAPAKLASWEQIVEEKTLNEIADALLEAALPLLSQWIAEDDRRPLRLAAAGEAMKRYLLTFGDNIVDHLLSRCASVTQDLTLVDDGQKPGDARLARSNSANRIVDALTEEAAKARADYQMIKNAFRADHDVMSHDLNTPWWFCLAPHLDGSFCDELRAYPMGAREAGPRIASAEEAWSARARHAAERFDEKLS